MNIARVCTRTILNVSFNKARCHKLVPVPSSQFVIGGGQLLVPKCAPDTCLVRGCVTKGGIDVVHYEDIKELPKYPEKLLVDVREPEELKETGRIPTSINIPLGVVNEELAFHVDRQQFKEKYGRSKPEPTTEIIFFCKRGRRSQEAAEIALGLGYRNVKNYVGSWLDWAERENLPKPQ